VIALVAEFPNDNPTLHAGVMWVCFETAGGPPIAVREAVPVVVEVEAAALPPASEPEPLEVAAPVKVEPPEQRESPRESGIVTSACVDDVDEPIVVEELEPLADAEMVEPVLPVAARPPDDFSLLCAAMAAVAPQVAPSLPVALAADGAAAAWRAILDGTSDDLSACGGATLDEWASELLARLLGDPSRAGALRRELRARGVAAFGLVEAA
jgi:hypothetical protein